MKSTDTDPLFYTLGEAWRDIQTVLFSTRLTDAERRSIEEGLRKIEDVRAQMEGDRE